VDAEGVYARASREVFQREGAFATVVPDSGSPPGLGAVSSSILIEEVARACGSSALMLMIQRLGALPLVLTDLTERHEPVLDRLRSGEWTPCFALTERSAGSDPSQLKTQARRDADDWVIDGHKQWISNAPEADVVVVFAVTDPNDAARRISAFLVETDRPGLSVGPVHRTSGLRGMSVGQMAFDGVRVGPDALLGDQGDGLKLALRTLDLSRLGVAAQAIGLAKAALDSAASHARERRQFGKPLIAHAGLAFPLADRYAHITAARTLLIEAATRADRGAADAGLHASMAKLVASEAAVSTTQAAIQAHGAAGYDADSDVQRYARDARATTIYEGTSEIQRMVIARWLAA